MLKPRGVKLNTGNGNVGGGVDGGGAVMNRIFSGRVSRPISSPVVTFVTTTRSSPIGTLEAVVVNMAFRLIAEDRARISLLYKLVVA